MRGHYQRKDFQRWSKSIFRDEQCDCLWQMVTLLIGHFQRWLNVRLYKLINRCGQLKMLFSVNGIYRGSHTKITTSKWFQKNHKTSAFGGSNPRTSAHIMLPYHQNIHSFASKYIDSCRFYPPTGSWQFGLLQKLVQHMKIHTSPN